VYAERDADVRYIAPITAWPRYAGDVAIEPERAAALAREECLT
jgi:hypothetical protein